MSFSGFYQTLIAEASAAFPQHRPETAAKAAFDEETLRPLYEAALQRANSAPCSDHRIPAPEGASYTHECYVDLVMEGGGILGISLIGYIYALEAAGIRFLSLGGTSAGSITALLTAACGKPGERKGGTLMDILGNMPTRDFMDGDSDARDFIFSYAEGMKPLSIKGLWKAAQIKDNLKKDMGLCHGDAFERWIAEKLSDFGCATLKHLRANMDDVSEELRAVIAPKPGKRLAGLGLVAADVTTETRVVFPKNAELFDFDKETADVNPARFVRASMSIPFIYKPYTLKVKRDAGALARWAEVTALPAECFTGDDCLPEICYLVDGGTVSNFPVDLFHVAAVPNRPTFGVKLQVEKLAYPVTDFFSLMGRAAGTARRILDREFIRKHSDYRHLVSFIDTDPHHWLNFGMSAEEKLDLIAKGMKAGFRFVAGFDWEGYKKIRQDICAAGVQPEEHKKEGENA